jgi:hemoglobin-like flavoprotein
VVAVGFLGPDMEPLEADLKVLGVRHIKYGVAPEFLPVMGKALLFTLCKILKEKL